MTNNPRILVVDDTPATLEVVRRNLESQGYDVTTSASAPSAIEILESAPVDLVITDLKMSGIGGLDLIRHIRAHYPEVSVMMITGYASIDTAVSAIREGAEDYLPKPFTDEELLNSVARVLKDVRVRQTIAYGCKGEPPRPLCGLVGESQAMRNISRFVSRVSSSPATVLINGESGTGKELVARAIHYDGARASGPFVAVNCAGIPEGLVESELFGHTKGAFTGAATTRAGFFIAANEGTIFLDEIAELAMPTQAKLLRALEEGEVRLVGSDQAQRVDVRVVAATNKDLSVLVDKSLFREDLFFRLNVLTITLPPLRERTEDVPLLIRYFLEKFAGQEGGTPPRLTDRALRALQGYHWPGNVRELQNVIQRLVVMAENHLIDVPDLPSMMRFGIQRRSDPNRTLQQVEQEHICTVLASVGGNKTRAAAILGIDRKTLREKLRQQQDR